jgi:hypothetical protein
MSDYPQRVGAFQRALNRGYKLWASEIGEISVCPRLFFTLGGVGEPVRFLHCHYADLCSGIRYLFRSEIILFSAARDRLQGHMEFVGTRAADHYVQSHCVHSRAAA